MDFTYASILGMKKSKIGKVDVSALNVPPEKHEYETAKYFANRGYDVTFVKPSDVKGFRSPDFAMCGRRWETKSPNGESRRTFEDNFRKAIKQSEHIILDLRRISSGHEEWCIKKTEKESSVSSVRTVLVITRDGRLLTIKGKFDTI